jgi:UDP-N-acetylglucosamine--N-acetylmuramyl-(pentapeptide) pyrophosphoryl-undecaprenol N-acetylglucosamine transferase
VKKFLISCGGTGGHLSPGIALAEGLRARGHEVTLLISWKKVDARLSEKYPDLRFVRIAGTGFSWQPLKLIRCLVSQLQGFRFCRKLVREMQPDGIVGFGGFTSAPIVLAGRLQGVPVALHESNRVPGLAIRTLGRFARRVYLPPGIRIAGVRVAATRYVGMPLRHEMMRLSQSASRAALGLEPNQKVLAILGGSQGASALNDWARRELPALAAEGIQVYCVTGLGKGEPETHLLEARNGAAIRAVFAPFCDRMADLLSASDLVISRAGAGTLAELIRCVTPAILVPYPQAADDHQRANAGFFERQGGGLVVAQTELGRLHAEVMDIIFNDWLLRQFRSNLQRMDRANSLDLLLGDLEEITVPPAAAFPGAAQASAA